MVADIFMIDFQPLTEESVKILKALSRLIANQKTREIWRVQAYVKFSEG